MSCALQQSGAVCTLHVVLGYVSWTLHKHHWQQALPAYGHTGVTRLACRHGTHAFFTTWQAVHDALRALVPASSIRYSAKVTGIDMLAPGQGALVSLANDEVISAGLVVAADGGFSKVRKWLHPDEPPMHHTDNHQWRAKLELSEQQMQGPLGDVAREGLVLQYTKVSGWGHAVATLHDMAHVHWASLSAHLPLLLSLKSMHRVGTLYGHSVAPDFTLSYPILAWPQAARFGVIYAVGAHTLVYMLRGSVTELKSLGFPVLHGVPPSAYLTPADVWGR